MIPRLKGTDDILPPASERWRRLLRTFDDQAERYGYDLVLTPAMEATELFARGVGEATEVVEKQMYTFEDQGGRSVTLRPEFTAGIVRAYVDGGHQGVLKVATSGPAFRYEQPQKGRRRQFFQLDLEYLGEPGAGADVDVIGFTQRLLEQVGVDGISLRVNSIGDGPDRVQYREELQAFLRSRRDRLSADAVRRIDTNPLRVLDSKADVEVVADAPVPIDHLGPEAAEHFAAVRRGLDALGISYDVEPRLVRGLDYYNRTVFEFFSSSFEAAQASLVGGGRYDPLAEAIGSDRPVPAVGMALGCDRVVAAMPDPDAARLDVFVAVADPARRDTALAWVARLRDQGLRVDWDAGGDRSMRAQFRAADRLGAAYAAVVGDEWDDGQVTLKDLGSGDERLVGTEEVVEWTRRR